MHDDTNVRAWSFDLKLHTVSKQWVILDPKLPVFIWRHKLWAWHQKNDKITFREKRWIGMDNPGPGGLWSNSSLQHIWLIMIKRILKVLLFSKIVCFPIWSNFWKIFLFRLFVKILTDILPLLNPLSANFTKWSNTLKQFVR